jgi:hypothetical protein
MSPHCHSNDVGVVVGFIGDGELRRAVTCFRVALKTPTPAHFSRELILSFQKDTTMKRTRTSAEPVRRSKRILRENPDIW